MKKTRTTGKVRIASAALAAMMLATCATGIAAIGEEGETALPNQVTEQNAEAAQALADQSTMPEDQRDSIQQEIGGTMNGISERAYENLPTTTTLGDGTVIQRTPATPDNGVTGNFTYDYLGWNTVYLDSDNRGCGACHGDLAELVENMGGEPHTQLSNGMGIDVQLRQCVDCHAYCTVLYDESDNFASIMHALHRGSNQAFTSLGGDCMSCHYVTSTGSYDQGLEGMGEIVLWDYVKYDLWRGISTVSADEAVTEFSFDQDYTLSADQMFNKNFFSDSTGVARKLSDHLDATPDPTTDGIYDTWEIEITGDVGNPVTMSISEMIEMFGLKTDTMTLHCDAGPVGTNLVGNFEITGIDLKDLMAYAQVNEDCNIITAYAPNGHNYSSQTSLVDANGGYLVLEVGGEPLSYQAGYPVQVWYGGAAAWCCEKQVCTLDFRYVEEGSDELPDWFFNTGLYDESGHSNYKPCIGVFDLKDGEVIEYAPGDVINLEGYASAYEVPIAAIEFSFDNGETWVTCETPDTTAKNWVHWQLGWTPPDQGAYVLQFRAVGTDGSVTMEPLKFLLNIQDSANPIDAVAIAAQAN